MLTVAFIFAFGCTFIELYIVTQIKFMHEKVLPFLEKYKGLALAFSVGLSYFIGELFGAEGVTIFMAAIFSTIISIWAYSSGLVGKYVHGAHKPFVAKLKHNIDITIRTFILIWKILTFPVRACMWCNTQYNTKVRPAYVSTRTSIKRLTHK